MRVFVAGATGVVGKPLVSALIAAGHEVTGTTRSPAKATELHDLGATPVIVDGLDRQAVLDAVKAAQPEVIVHQMTALAGLRSLRNFDKQFAATNELRTKGTDYLLEAARQAGAPPVHRAELHRLEQPRPRQPGRHRIRSARPAPRCRRPQQTLAAVRHVEQAVPAAVPEGLVLRYGPFYGHGASDAMLDVVRKRQMPVIGGGAGIWSFCEVTDAAAATAAAVTRGAPGLYNIVDDDPAPVREWLPVPVREPGGASRPGAPRPGWAGCWPARRPWR